MGIQLQWGYLAAVNNQGGNSVAVGYLAGGNNQSGNSVAVGYNAGNMSQGAGASAIAIGFFAGNTSQGSQAVAMGSNAGQYSQGSYAVAIGNYAGHTSQHANSIILNANSTALNSGAASAFYVSPVRNVIQTNILGYDATSKEVSYWSLSNITTTNISSASIRLSADAAFKPTTNTWTISSDERLKTNITQANLDTCYDNVKNIPLKRYTWRDDVYTTEQVHDRSKLGWIAQDVETFLPKAVEQMEMFGYPDCRTLNSDQLIASLYGSVQKLINDVETEREQHNATKQAFDNLKTELQIKFPGEFN